MKYADKRKEAGKMFIDVAKYVFTVSIIGRIFSEQFTIDLFFLSIVIFSFCFSVGVYLIPPNKN